MKENEEEGHAFCQKCMSEDFGVYFMFLDGRVSEIWLECVDCKHFGHVELTKKYNA